MKKTPRTYQAEAFTALVKAAVTPADSENGFQIPYASMCTGSGKSLVAAMLTNKALNQGGRVLQLVPSKELVEQNYEEAWHYIDSPDQLGICCAKLNRAQIHKRAVIATYTSFLRRSAHSGAFNLCIIDEAHGVSPEFDSSYRKIIRSLLRINPKMKIVGLTATPYRMVQGMLHNDCVQGKALFTGMVYETNIPDLIKQGYLSHVESISGDIEADMTGVAMSGTDYNTHQMSVKFDAIVADAVADMRVKFDAYGINTALIFASSLENAQHIMTEWGGDDMRIVWGDMPNQERTKTLKWIKEHEGRRFIVNVGVLTTGFDYRALDCVVLMRATMSLGLYVQMVGRVIRAHDDKPQGYVIDYGGNIERHGPIDATLPPKTKKKRGEAPRKLCTLTLDESIEFEGVQYKRGQDCNYANILTAKFCRKCGGEFITENEEGGYSMRSKAQILAAKIEAATEHIEIEGVVYAKAYSRKDQTPMIKALMYTQDGELVYTHYICLEHGGKAGKDGKEFILNLFKDPADYYELGQAGVNVDNVVHLLNNAEHYFNKITSITIRPQRDNRKYFELVGATIE